MQTLNWFEIPCKDLARAARFYETVLDISLRREDFMGVPHAIFRSALNAESEGALVQDTQNAPSPQGTRLYLNATGKLDACLARVLKHGGEVVLPRTDIGPMGAIAVLRDTEGNLVGLHTS